MHMAMFIRHHRVNVGLGRKHSSGDWVIYVDIRAKLVRSIMMHLKFCRLLNVAVATGSHDTREILFLANTEDAIIEVI